MIFFGYLERNYDLLSLELMSVSAEFVTNKKQINLGSHIIRNNISISENVGRV
jgi:hypothetical protein